MKKPISIAFFGSSDNSLVVLKALKDHGFDIQLVISAPPRPVGRSQILTKTSPHRFAEEHHLPVLTPEKLDPSFLQAFTASPLDVAIVADYAKLIPKAALEHPKHGCLNLHPSLLPKYRGASPGEFAILAGEPTTGMTIIRMDEEFDHGPIVAQFEEPIRDSDTSETLYRRLFTAGAEVLTTILPAWIAGRITLREQGHSQATSAPRLSRDDGFVPWKFIERAMQGQDVSIEEYPNTWKVANGTWPMVLERAIRAFHPWPGVWTNVPYKAGMKRMKILSAHLNPKPYPLDPVLILDRVQLEGKKPNNWKNLAQVI